MVRPGCMKALSPTETAHYCHEFFGSGSDELQVCYIILVTIQFSSDQTSTNLWGCCSISTPVGLASARCAQTAFNGSMNPRTEPHEAMLAWLARAASLPAVREVSNDCKQGLCTSGPTNDLCTDASLQIFWVLRTWLLAPFTHTPHNQGLRPTMRSLHSIMHYGLPHFQES